MPEPSRIDFVLATLAAAEIGSIASIAEKLRRVEQALSDLNQPALALRAREAIAALERGDAVEFKRIRAFLQAKTGHLR
ncbi:MAG: hypothetical protein JXO72_12550 [Vicinamibacteria bacterium]|nr:hypothetical protein [Vicinamibacteria bacterium]